MYLPRTLPLCEPHIATWIGKSGRRYDFAVSRPAATWLDEAAVFLLVRSAADHTDVLHIGHTCSLHKRFGAARDRCPELWRRALAAGMTHVHLRFEACTDRARQAEVDDLMAVLKPSLIMQPTVEDAPVAEVAAPLGEVAVEALDEDVLVPYRARLKITRLRDPHIDIEAFDADLARSDLPFGHAFEASRSYRSDPARECDVVPDDFDAAVPLVVGVEVAAPVVILPSSPDVAAILPVVEPAAAPLPDAAPAIIGDDGVPASAEPLVVAVDPAVVDAPAEDALVPAPAAAAVAAEAQPAAVAGLPEGSSATGTAGIATAAGDERTDPAPRGKQRSAGLLGRLLHAVSGRGSRWFGARPQPSQESTLASIPAADATSADGHDISLPPAAADAMHPAAVVPAEGTPADRMDAVEVAAADITIQRHAGDEGSPEPAREPVFIEVAAPDADIADYVVVGLKRDEAGAGLRAAGDPVPIAENREEADEELPADAEVPPAEAEAAAVAPMPVNVPDPVPVAVAPVPAAPRGARAGLRAADTDAGRPADDAAKRSFGCDPGQPLVLFADAVSGEAGADILAEALFTVCGTDDAVQVIFAGEGELRGELCGRIGSAGLGERCRFLGDVACERFQELMLAADILVIPARAGRGDGLASRAIRHGKWVLATHQAQVSCVVHGENGLLTYDNPGSLVWGIRELVERVRSQRCAARAEAA